MKAERFTINTGTKAHIPNGQVGVTNGRVEALCGSYAFVDRPHMTYHPVTLENTDKVTDCTACNKRSFLTTPSKHRL